MNKREEKRRTAHHEAGHAVIACVFGVELKSATILVKPFSDGWAGGSVSFKGWREDWEAHAPPDDAGAIIGLAGPMAELRYAPRLRNRDGWGSDRRQAAELVGGDPARIHAAEAKARDLVAQHWPAIQRVATALLDRSRLSREEIVAAMLSLDHLECMPRSMPEMRRR
jgi:Zn-dependent protease